MAVTINFTENINNNPIKDLMDTWGKLVGKESEPETLTVSELMDGLECNGMAPTISINGVNGMETITVKEFVERYGETSIDLKSIRPYVGEDDGNR